MAQIPIIANVCYELIVLWEYIKKNNNNGCSIKVYRSLGSYVLCTTQYHAPLSPLGQCMGNTGEFELVFNEKCAPRVGNLTSNFINPHLIHSQKYHLAGDLIIQFAQMMGYLLTCLVKSPPSAPGGIVGLTNHRYIIKTL